MVTLGLVVLQPLTGQPAMLNFAVSVFRKVWIALILTLTLTLTLTLALTLTLIFTLTVKHEDFF